jgi:hypothetical protein
MGQAFRAGDRKARKNPNFHNRSPPAVTRRIGGKVKNPEIIVKKSFSGYENPF